MEPIKKLFAGLWRDHRRTLVAVLVALAAGGGVTVAVVVDTDGDGTPDRTVTVPLPYTLKANITPGDGLPTRTVEVDAREVVRADERVEEGEPRKDPAKPSPAVAAAIDLNKERYEPLPTAGAVQGFRGCRTRLLPVNWNSRNGVRPVWFELHYAVIRNQPGWGDLDLLWGIFANPGRQASSHFGIDAEGNCIYMVPIESKAWTAVDANPFTISVEAIAWGDEPEYLPPAGMAKLRSIARQVRARTGIPLRRGTVSANNLCVPGRSGITHHHDHLTCGGAHVDINPFSIEQLVRQVSRPTSPLTTVERRIVAGSSRPKFRGHSQRYWCGRARGQVRRLDRIHRRGRPWKVRNGGKRRRIVARAAAANCG